MTAARRRRCSAQSPHSTWGTIDFHIQIISHLGSRRFSILNSCRQVQTLTPIGLPRELAEHVCQFHIMILFLLNTKFGFTQKLPKRRVTNRIPNLFHKTVNVVMKLKMLLQRSRTDWPVSAINSGELPLCLITDFKTSRSAAPKDSQLSLIRWRWKMTGKDSDAI